MAGRGGLRKIITIVANRCHTSKPKCTKSDFGWGAYSASSYPIRGILLRKGGEGIRRGKEG